MTCMSASIKASKFGLPVSFQSLWSSLVRNEYAPLITDIMSNLVPRVFSQFNMALENEKILVEAAKISNILGNLSHAQ